MLKEIEEGAIIPGNDLSDQGTRLMFSMIQSCCKCSRNYVVVDCKAKILQNENDTSDWYHEIPNMFDQLSSTGDKHGLQTVTLYISMIVSP